MTIESEEEFEEETEEETKEEEEDSPKHFDTFPTMKELGLHYSWIMSNKLEPRMKPLNPKKSCNFVGRVRGLKVCIGNFTYECDFMVLEDTTSVIDHDLGLVVFGKPFVEMTGLMYDMREGTVVFEKDKEKIVFKMPHKMEMFKHIDFTDIKPDRIPPFAIESDDDNSEKTHYSDSLDLGPEYKYDENQLDGIGGNTRTGLILERKDKDLTDLHQNLLKNDANRAWRRRRDLSSDNVMDLTTTSERSRLKPALEDSTWRRRHDYNTTSS
ncbi:protein kinase-like domain, concanavalin A-like lectin/glucanase domain protein [Tanacetum coccineum]